MENTTKDISQRYWVSEYAPYLTVRSTQNSTQSYKEHYHSELSVGIIKTGSTCLSLPEQDLVLNKGEVILIEPNLVHACNPLNKSPRSYYMLYVDSNWCCEALSTLYGYDVAGFVVDQDTLPLFDCSLESAMDKLLEQDSVENASTVENILFDILSRYSSPIRAQSIEDTLALKVRERLLQDVESPPSLDTLSSEFGQTKETLIRRFKRYFGITPKAFLNNHRIEKAKFLLKSGKSIVDVAVEVGFSDQSQLHKAFVNYTASTPRQYQQVRSIFDNN